MIRPLLFVTATAALLASGCDDRECEFYNDCGSGAYCTNDFTCEQLPEPDLSGGVSTTRFPPMVPELSENTEELSGEASLGGAFGPRVSVADGPAAAFVDSTDFGSNVIVDRWEDDGALLWLSTSQPLREALPPPGGLVTFDDTDPTNTVMICWEEAAMYDVNAESVTITATQQGDTVVYDVTAQAYSEEPSNVTGRFTIPDDAG